MITIILLTLSLPICIYIYLYYFYPDIPKITGIPEPPGASLIYGHLPLLGHDHATTCEAWSQSKNWPVFQIRLGYRRVIVLNSFNAAKDWLIMNQAATIDRPQFYTFHKVVSKTSAATIGTNPWNERTRKQRLVAGSLTTAPAIKRMAPLLDLETGDLLKSLADEKSAMVPHLYLKKLALNIILMWCYGRRFDSIDNSLLRQILSDATLISTFRSTSLNSQDFVPHLRYLPRFLQDTTRAALATEVRTRRDKWLGDLLEEVRLRVESGKASDCVAAGLFSDGNGRLTEHDIRTILGGLVSGGFDTIANTAIAGIMYLCSAGQAVQQRAYEDIIQSYGSVEEAFKNAVHEEKSTYVVAFVREVLRFYPPIKILPPRQAYKDFTDSDGVSIPAGVMILVNCQAINRDSSIYGSDADQFRPERWLDRDCAPPPYHLAYGAGSRICTAVNFSNRIVYAIFVRLILSFRIGGSEECPPELDYVDYNRDTSAATACPKDFEAMFELRDPEQFAKCLHESEHNINSEVSNGIMKK